MQGAENWAILCDHFSKKLAGEQRLQFVFVCNKTAIYGEAVELEQVCDESTDCTNSADELGCPGRFYCSTNESLHWIPESKMCDHVKDCTNGADECDFCDFGALSSKKLLIRSKIVLILTVVIGSLVVLLNIAQGFKCYKSKSLGKAGRLDRLFRLQIFFHQIS